MSIVIIILRIATTAAVIIASKIRTRTIKVDVMITIIIMMVVMKLYNSEKSGMVSGREVYESISCLKSLPAKAFKDVTLFRSAVREFHIVAPVNEKLVLYRSIRGRGVIIVFDPYLSDALLMSCFK